MTKSTFIPILCLLTIMACKRSNCISYGVRGVIVSTKDKSNITDTMLKAWLYPNNGSFQYPTDSFSKSFAEYPTNTIAVMTDSTNSVTFDHDILCVLYPSGKIYRITGINHENNKSDKPGLSCVNPEQYTVNGNPTSAQGYMGMDGYLLNIDY